jgi:hypothetical protein
MNAYAHLCAAFANHGHAFADFFWDSKIFQKETWDGIIIFIRLVLTLGGAMLLIYEARARKLGEPLRKRKLRRWALALAVISFCSYFDFGNAHTRYSEFYHRHEFYHYYLGSKYSRELGYVRLYECTAIAEVDLGHGDDVRKQELRDLRVNLIIPMTDSYVFSDPEKCKRRFTAERWEDFKHDVDWFRNSANGDYWHDMKKDHGYNPPPVWTMSGKFFASLAPAGDGFFKLLASIDVILHALTLWLMWWAFGWRVGLATALFWGVNAAANTYFTGGAFLRQDWLLLFVASVAFARKRKFVLAGAALTWSSLLRAFPIVALFGWGVIIGIHVFRRWQLYRAGQVPAQGYFAVDSWLGKDHQRLLAGCIIAASVLIPASVVVTGPNSYAEFYQHTLHTHDNTPLSNHMGLRSIMASTWEGRMRFLRNDNLADSFQEWKQGRVDRNEAQKPIRWAIIGFIALWTVWSLRKTKLLWLGPVMSLPLLMCTTELTCYYYSFFIVAAALIRQRPTFGPPLLAISGASQIVSRSFYWVDDKFVAMSYLYLLLSLLMLYVYSRPFSLERMRTWLEGKRETLPHNSARRLNLAP